MTLAKRIAMRVLWVEGVFFRRLRSASVRDLTRPYQTVAPKITSQLTPSLSLLLKPNRPYLKLTHPRNSLAKNQETNSKR